MVVVEGTGEEKVIITSKRKGDFCSYITAQATKLCGDVN